MSNLPSAIAATAVKLSTGKLYWLGLTVLGFAMEGIALYYQYALGDEPCQICVHIRIWVAAFILLSLLMCVLPRKKYLNISAHLVSLGLMAGLWERCKYLLDLENGKGHGSCSFFLDFPEWFALDKWMPAVFEVRNLCSFTPELLFGITMAQGLMALAWGLVLISLAALYLNVTRYEIS